MGVQDAGQRHPPPGQLLDDAGIRGGIQPQPAVSRVDGGPEQAELTHLGEHRLGELIGVLQVRGVGYNLPIHPGADRPDQFVGQLGIHSETTIGHFPPLDSPGA